MQKLLRTWEEGRPYFFALAACLASPVRRTGAQGVLHRIAGVQAGAHQDGELAPELQLPAPEDQRQHREVPAAGVPRPPGGGRERRHVSRPASAPRGPTSRRRTAPGSRRTKSQRRSSAGWRTLCTRSTNSTSSATLALTHGVARRRQNAIARVVPNASMKAAAKTSAAVRAAYWAGTSHPVKAHCGGPGQVRSGSGPRPEALRGHPDPPQRPRAPAPASRTPRTAPPRPPPPRRSPSPPSPGPGGVPARGGGQRGRPEVGVGGAPEG